jgi:hypothetical protein
MICVIIAQRNITTARIEAAESYQISQELPKTALRVPRLTWQAKSLSSAFVLGIRWNALALH